MPRDERRRNSGPAPCKGCGQPKGSGPGRRYCEACKAQRNACVVCGGESLKGRRTCSDECLSESRTAAAYHAITNRLRNAKPRTLPSKQTCSRCHETWPLTTEHFGPERRDLETGEIVRFNRWCRSCKAADGRARHAARTPEQVERDREYAQAVYALRRLSPEQLEADRRRKIEWNRRNPEKVAAASRRYNEKLKSDPDRHAERLVNDRIDYRLQRMREGHELAMNRGAVEGYVEDVGGGTERKAVEPLAAWLDVVIAREVPDLGMMRGTTDRDNRSRTVVDLAAELGVPSRRLWAIRRRAQERVAFTTADRMLTNYGRPVVLDGDAMAESLEVRCRALPGNGDRILRYIDLAEMVAHLDGAVVVRAEDLYPALDV